MSEQRHIVICPECNGTGLIEEDQSSQDEGKHSECERCDHCAGSGRLWRINRNETKFEPFIDALDRCYN